MDAAAWTNPNLSPALRHLSEFLCAEFEGAIDGRTTGGIVGITLPSHRAVVVRLSLWSLLDELSENDLIQIEVNFVLPKLEAILEHSLGQMYASQNHASLSVFLHRLFPDGRRYATGFPASATELGSASVVVAAVRQHVLPFAKRLSNRQTYFEELPLDPKTYDCFAWAVRRLLVRVALNAGVLSTEIESDAEQTLAASLESIAASRIPFLGSARVHERNTAMLGDLRELILRLRADGAVQKQLHEDLQDCLS